MPSPVVVALAAGAEAPARALAARLGLPFGGTHPDWRALEAPLLLLLGPGGLALAAPGGTGIGPVAVDFDSPRLRHRLRGITPRREDLARAVGLPAPRTLHVVDATAGWGRDSAVLAALGCEVTMIERHAVVAALLADALGRARASQDALTRALGARLALREGDAVALLEAGDARVPDVVLIDPMFPGKAKDAAAGREMQLFQRLVGPDADAEALLDAALAAARHRVVVKRPRGAGPLAGRAPDFALQGRSTRFDVHVLRRIG